MSIIGQLIVVHAVTGLRFWFCLSTIQGNMADRTYQARMSSPLRFFLMPGRPVERAAWVRQQRVMACIGLVMASIVYVGAMIKILS
jgi:hypothetical protein